MKSDSLRIKTVFVSVLRPIICTGKMGGIIPKGGKLKKCHAPKKFSTHNFGGCFEVDLHSVIHVVCHDIVYKNVQKI